MIRQMIIILRSEFLQLMESSERNIREIVVFDVVANIVQWNIQEPVVGMGCQVICKQIVLTDDMAGHWMRSKAEDCTHKKVSECIIA